MNIITLDFETFYSKDYSLSKLTTEAYVRDPRFKAHGCGIRWPDGTGEWVSHADLPAVFATIDWSNTAVLAHHAQFDGLILSHHYGRHPALWLDTLSMARMRALPGALAKLADYYRLKPKGDALVQTLGMRDLPAETERALAEYCLHDVELTWDIFRRLSAEFPPQELRAIDLTVRMFTRPLLRIDPAALRAYQGSERARKAELLQAAGVDAALLRSTQQFRAWLESRGVDPLPPTCAKTDKAMQALLDHPDEQVAAAVAARLGVASSIGETRAQRMIDMAGRGAACVYLKYWGAHTGRWSGGDKLNFQNLRKGTALRTALHAPPGHQVVVMDSSQIEVRVLAWLAGQRDVLDNFAAGRDVYREFGAVVYGLPPDQIDDTQRFVSKSCILGLGFGTGHVKLRQTLAQGTTGPVVEVSEAEAQRLVSVYRTQHAHVVALWRDADRLIRAMAKGTPLTIADGRVSVVGYGVLQTLPGIRLYYPGLRLEADGFVYGHGRDETKLYGAKLVENCIGEGTLVLTNRGWVRIEKITPEHLVFDGVEFVNHGVTLYNGVRLCTQVDGVAMTPDHKVLTHEGWKTASQNPEPYRPDLRGIPGACTRAQQREKTVLDSEVPVWGRRYSDRRGFSEGGSDKLRLFSLGSVATPKESWYEQTPGLSSMAQYVRQVQTSISSSMEKLRRSWNYSLRTLAKQLRGFLDGYGSYLSTRAYLRSDRQFFGVLPRELPVGVLHTASSESPWQFDIEHPKGGYDGMRGRRYIRYKTDDAPLPASSQLGCGGSPYDTCKTTKHVYDIVNCGPRQRFVVLGKQGPLIVHNCVQHYARMVIAEQMVEIGKRWPIVTTTHDEIVCIAPDDKAQACHDDMQRIMSMHPAWAQGLVLAAKGGFAEEYSK